MLDKTELNERLKKIALVVLDVDGVMTGGEILLGGVDELKSFNSLDGHGIRLLERFGTRTAIITGRQSRAVERRATELGIADIIQNAKDKLPFFRELIARLGLAPEQALYVGDDLPDLPVMRNAGVGVAVANAHEELLARADYVTRARGGEGAIREVADMILKAQGKWDKLMERYLSE